MAECAYCGDTIDGKPIVKNSKKYCTQECADLDEEDEVEEDDDAIEDEEEEVSEED